MLRTRITTLAVALAALAFPAAAIAQSAGQDQYSDPLAGSGGSSHHSTSHHSTSSGSSGSRASAGTGSSTTSPASATTSTPSTGSSQASAAAGSSKQLPRTGFELLIPVELGFALLLSGVTLRRLVVLRDRA